MDNVVQKSGHLLESMKPAINPPAEIDDPDDHKPSDWVDDAKIPGTSSCHLAIKSSDQETVDVLANIDHSVALESDPAASKPDDWDEDAPKTILDMSVEMPDGGFSQHVAAAFVVCPVLPCHGVAEGNASCPL